MHCSKVAVKMDLNDHNSHSSSKQPHKRRGPYKAHLVSPDVKEPKTSKWRKLRTPADKEKSVTCSTTGIELEDGSVAETSDAKRKPDCDGEAMLSEVSDDQEDTLFDETSTTSNITSERFADDEDEINLEDSFIEQETTAYSNDKSNDKEEPIYVGSRLTVGVSMLLIMTFAMKHGLSGVGLADLLSLIEMHCMVPNLCKQSLSIFNQFFMRLKSPVQFHYFCKFCSTYVGHQKLDRCGMCSRSETMSYFIVIPIVAQLQSTLNVQNIWELLSYRKSRRSNEQDDITDVMDGKLYQELFDNGYFRGTPETRKDELHISLQFNTDGVSLFRSSTFSVWPIYMVINELPPKERLSRQYRLFAGLWFGKNKPVMDIFLKPLIDELCELYNEGTKIVIGGQLTKLRAVLLSIVCDAPARCMMQNFTQFNGFYGCATCNIRGKSLKTSAGGSVMTYPYDNSEEYQPDGHPLRRTHRDSLKFALRAVETNTPCNGVKGYSLLYELPHFNIVRGVTVDYMHCVLLGVMKMLLKLWFETKNKGKDFFIGPYSNVLNERILSITPPRIITRAPRSLVDLAHWKASEYRSFLLFYSIPCLWGILPDSYLDHFILFVNSVFILLRSKISKSDLRKARSFLSTFCKQFNLLYSPRYETSNFHSLLHLCDKVEDLGPLWSQSCFFFEDLNGDLRGLFHGTQKIEIQIALAVAVQQQIPKLCNCLVPGSAAEKLLNKMTKRFTVNNRQFIDTCLDKDLFIVGFCRKCTLSREISSQIEKICGEVKLSEQFFRLLLGGMMYHSKEYSYVVRRNSYCIQYYEDNITRFGSIQYYLRCYFENGVKCFAVLRDLAVSQTNLSHLNQAVQHLTPVKEILTSKCILISQIMEPCVFLDVEGLQQQFVCNFPNFVEHE